MQSMHVYTALVRLYTGRPWTNKIDCFLHNDVGFFPQSWTQMLIYFQLFSHLLICYDHSFKSKKEDDTECTFWWYLHSFGLTDMFWCSSPTMHCFSISFGISTNTGLKGHDVLEMCPNVNPKTTKFTLHSECGDEVHLQSISGSYNWKQYRHCLGFVSHMFKSVRQV